MNPQPVRDAAQRPAAGYRPMGARRSFSMLAVVAAIMVAPGPGLADVPAPVEVDGPGEVSGARDESTPAARARDETALASARDGRDHREEAFAAIIDIIRRDGGSLAGAIAIMPDPSEALEDVEALRGRRFQVSGVLLERSRLQRPWAHVEEWFVRHESGTPFIVFVVETDPEMMVTPVPAGVLMQAPARLYKRIDAVARDGEERSYIAFVTDAQFVRPVRVTDPAFRSAAPLLALIIMLLPVLLVVRLLLRHVQTRRAAGGYAGEDSNETSDAEDLPDHPMEALHELRRRAVPEPADLADSAGRADRAEGDDHGEHR